jgi:hypothetical protein
MRFFLDKIIPQLYLLQTKQNHRNLHSTVETWRASFAKIIILEVSQAMPPQHHSGVRRQDEKLSTLSFHF